MSKPTCKESDLFNKGAKSIGCLNTVPVVISFLLVFLGDIHFLGWWSNEGEVSRDGAITALFWFWFSPAWVLTNYVIGLTFYCHQLEQDPALSHTTCSQIAFWNYLPTMFWRNLRKGRRWSWHKVLDAYLSHCVLAILKRTSRLNWSYLLAIVFH